VSRNDNHTTDASLRSNQQLPQAPAQLPPCGSTGGESPDEGGEPEPDIGTKVAGARGAGAPSCAAAGLTPASASASARKSAAAVAVTTAAAGPGPGRRAWCAIVMVTGVRGGTWASQSVSARGTKLCCLSHTDRWSTRLGTEQK